MQRCLITSPLRVREGEPRLESCLEYAQSSGQGSVRPQCTAVLCAVCCGGSCAHVANAPRDRLTGQDTSEARETVPDGLRARMCGVHAYVCARNGYPTPQASLNPCEVCSVNDARAQHEPRGTCFETRLCTQATSSADSALTSAGARGRVA